MIFTQIEHKNLCILDIETTTQYEYIGQLKTDKPSLYKAFCKKAEWYAENEYKTELTDELLQTIYQEKGPLMAEFGKIICISVGGIKEDQAIPKISFYSTDETLVLNGFCTFLSQKLNKTPALVMTGYNIMFFDIPFIIKRLVINRISVPTYLRIYDKKPWDLTARFKDIFTLWQMNTKNFVSLDLLASSFGIETHKDEMNGSMVYRVYYDGFLEDIKNYCEQDIELTGQVILFLTD
jgi:predicted PolB exonuclease-like 3'-5' exonuclease